MRPYERASTLLTSNRPVEERGKLLGDVAAVTAMLDRLLHHGHVLKCGTRSWCTKSAATTAGNILVVMSTGPMEVRTQLVGRFRNVPVWSRHRLYVQTVGFFTNWLEGNLGCSLTADISICLTFASLRQSVLD